MTRHDRKGKTYRSWLGTILIAFVLLAVFACSAPNNSVEPTVGRIGAEAYLEQIKSDPVRLEAFLHAMPKGGDLHSHLSGVPYAESFLRWAAADNMCISTATWLISGTSPCPNGFLSAAEVMADKSLNGQAIDGLSMRNFPLNPPYYGHDHFFATFSLIGAVSGAHRGDMLAETSVRAADDHTDYLELFITFQGFPLSQVADAYTWTGDLDSAYVTLLPGITALLGAGTSEIDGLVSAQRTALGCSDSNPPAACDVTIRFIQQANRTSSNSRVFASLLFGAEMETRDNRLVAVDLVSPEDNAASLSNYSTHMAMLAFLKQKYPTMKSSLHAGELTSAFVSAADLTFHITEAVRTAGTDRIGHGVSLKNEPGWEGLLAYMAQNRIGAAMNLTSNAQILGVTGDAHPFMSYLNAGVPVVVSTDDQGISRSNHTAEFLRAVTAYNLRWSQIKGFTRNSLDLSFLNGNGLWRTPGQYTQYVSECADDSPAGTAISDACEAYLLANSKAAEQWRLEGKLIQFENRY